MGAHSGARKWFGLWTHTGRHSDDPILEPDQEPDPEPERSGRHRAPEPVRRSASATAATVRLPDPVDGIAAGAHHRRSRVWTSAGLSAAVVLISFGACAAFSTQTDTQMPNRRTLPTETPSQNRPSTPVPLADAERHTEPPDPLPGTRQGTSAESPSGSNSQPLPATVPTVAPSTDPITPSPRPRVTVTHQVPASPQPQPTVTVTETVRATETAFLPLPRVTVTVTLPVPVPSG